MSFGGRTPESLLPRSDSKNPATTCKGITASGRPCRRALAATPTDSPSPSPNGKNGVLAVLDTENVAAFFCWQHKDQAESLAIQSEKKTTLFPLKERSSLDTLADRVGILDLDEPIQRPKRVRRRRTREEELLRPRRDTLPSGWHNVQSPLMTIPEDAVKPYRSSRIDSKPARSNTKLSWSCCLQSEEDDRPHASRRQTHNVNTGYSSPAPMQAPYQRSTLNTHPAEVRRKTMPSQQQHAANQHHPISPSLSQSHTPNISSSNSHTQNLLALIPPTLSPQITSSLLNELSRPISVHDEPGYIYIFWLTPDSEASKPDDETASSLFDSDDVLTRSPERASRTTTALNRYASVKQQQHQPVLPSSRTVLLKIGRAQNVHRRLSQWTKQCGQNITLVRYYPYPSPNTSQLPINQQQQGSPKKVPFVARVERLIHLELASKRVKQEKCEQCGREHREWFEIAATRKGLREVDGVVRRWVGWAEREAERDKERDEEKKESEMERRGERAGENTHAQQFQETGPSRERDRGRGENRSSDLGGYY